MRTRGLEETYGIHEVSENFEFLFVKDDSSSWCITSSVSRFTSGD